jgi:hypothetical protein
VGRLFFCFFPFFLFFFHFQFCDVPSRMDNHPYEELAKFGYLEILTIAISCQPKLNKPMD